MNQGEAPGEEAVTYTTDSDTSDDEMAVILRRKAPRTTYSHPPTDLIYKLWEAFANNVNPLMKMMHIPSLQPAIEKAANNIADVPTGFESLMFAIYSMAVLSLPEAECKETFGEARTVLLPRYVAATRAALSRARFMSSTSIVVLQALVLHLHAIRDREEPRAVWNLTGVAIRIAEAMGVMVDGALLRLPPFETEIRRRIWWKLKIHDLRAAELCGQSQYRGYEIREDAPKQPANVSDSDIYPGMKDPPKEASRPVQMTWATFRSELFSISVEKGRTDAMINHIFNTNEYSLLDDYSLVDAFIAETQDMMETKYLRFCDPSQPLQFFFMLGARIETNLLRFFTHHPRKWVNADHVPASEQKLVWDIVITLLEQYNVMQTNPELARFSWSVPYFIQWYAVIHVLDTLRADPVHPEATKAWRLIEVLYTNNMEILLSTNKPIFLALGNLCLRAQPTQCDIEVADVDGRWSSRRRKNCILWTKTL